MQKQEKSRGPQRHPSPGRLTAKRFFRNRLAVAGLVILGVMFAFSFLGGALIPYGQDQIFYREELQRKEYAGVTRNESYRFLPAPGRELGAVLQAQFSLAVEKQDSFVSGGVAYTVRREGEALYALYDDALVGIAYKDIVTPAKDFDFTYAALTAYTNARPGFGEYTLSGPEVLLDGETVAHISRLVIQPRQSGGQITKAFREQVEQAVALEQTQFSCTENGQTRQFSVHYDPANRLWSVGEETATLVWDSYAAPSRVHPLGTDKNGMDMLTRLMYGGRVSLVIGFIVVLIAGLIGVTLGGAAGYFGGWADNLVMRTVDIFYCIPSTPLLIILGAAMDGMRVEPRIRMLFLMLILGLLGWPGIARLVRGQILSLREQEFMTAAEAIGLRASRRIFRHLIPNVIPQLIVICTMSLGSTILTEATLSFLGLGVKFPFASWGNIMNDVSNVHVLTSYWFVWIPAGLCLVLSVLGFNFVGDGLRDAFDPKMKR